MYTIFIKPVVHAELTNDPAKNKATFKVLNNILDTTTSVLDGFRGHLRQFIVDDKGTRDWQCFLLLNFTKYLYSPIQPCYFHFILGVILIATFGLRGSTSPNM